MDTAPLTSTTARRMRVRSHLLTGSALTPGQVVERAVALQGQNLGAVLEAIALRARPGTTVADVREAFDRGELVRSWPMRGTLFATTPRDLATLLHVTGPRILRATSTRRAGLGIDDTTIARAWDVLGEALSRGPLPRARVMELWESCAIPTGGGVGYHLLMHLAVAGHVHWGAFDPAGTGQLLTLSPAVAPTDPEASLVEVVGRYVRARGPVTEADLAWWSKLPRRLLRHALAGVEGLVEVEVNGTRALLVVEDADPCADSAVGHAPTLPDPPASGVVLLPAFDEWVLGYADRSLVASPAMTRGLAPGGNGVFRPVVVVDGRIVGTWTRRPGRRDAAGGVDVDLVEEVPPRVRTEIERIARHAVTRRGPFSSPST